MICPMCTLPMKRIVVRDVEIDHCANDHRFFDRHELGRVDPRGAAFEAALVAATEGLEAGDRRRACARCSTTMVHLEHDGQKAEVCKQCGGILLWRSALDADVGASVAMAGVGVSSASSYSAPDLVTGPLEVAGTGFELLEFVFEVISAFVD